MSSPNKYIICKHVKPHDTVSQQVRLYAYAARTPASHLAHCSPDAFNTLHIIYEPQTWMLSVHAHAHTTKNYPVHVQRMSRAFQNTPQIRES